MKYSVEDISALLSSKNFRPLHSITNTSVNAFIEYVDDNGYKYAKMIGSIFKTNRHSKIFSNNPYNIHNAQLFLNKNNRSITVIDFLLIDNDYSFILECNVCKERFIRKRRTASLANTLKSGCPYCVGFYVGKTNNLAYKNPELLKEWDYEKNIITPDKITPGSHKKVWWICPDCGYSYYANPNNRVSSKTGCPNCQKSKGEAKVIEVLKKLGIPFIGQHSFNELIGVGGGKLLFDFFIYPDTFIEFHGQFHDGNGPHYVQQQFVKQSIHDKRKIAYAMKHGYKVIVIWYYEFDQIEEILTKFLS